MDTIFAVATASGRAGIAVVRISGALALNVLSAFSVAPVSPRVASLRRLFWDGALIDEAVVIFFPAGQSFTGEPVVELQVHGSIAVQRKILSCLAGVPGFRPAEAGEFTRRALEFGRLDLVQVEALADLIDAETEVQRKQATSGFQGVFSRKVELWRDQLIRAAALIEATIDFADEDVPFDVIPEVESLLLALLQDFKMEHKAVSFAERVRHGFEVAIVGVPNAGKSTLLNCLARRDVAITSDIAGTTRDIVEVRLELSGLPVTLLDTAGLRATEDQIEGIGVSRAISRAKAADLRLFLGEVGDSLEMQEGDIMVRPKVDFPDGQEPLGVSGLTGHGVDHLCEAIAQTLMSRAPNDHSATRVRHAVALGRGIEVLERVLTDLLSGRAFPELLAEDMRYVISVIDGIVGRIGVEDLLGEIFGRFCIGK